MAITDNTAREFNVLFIIFNRPETTDVVFETIRRARPSKLFIAADGPRPGMTEEADDCERARSVAQHVDWECQVSTLFHKENLGCRAAVSSAISWFFQHVDEGVILEDDCLPDDSFFPFCLELLEKYRHDTRVMHIAGHNFQFDRRYGSGSYYYSQLSHIWGWASWRRVWQLYDPAIPDFPAFLNQGGLDRIFRSRDMRKYYSEMFDRVYRNRINTWDHQLAFTILKNNGLCVIPNKNLIENIGFNSGTHTAWSSFSFLKKIAVGRRYAKLLSNKKQGMPFPLVHPDFMVPSYEADHRYFLKNVYSFSMRVYLFYLHYIERFLFGKE